MAGRVTIADLAKAAQVSVATVDRIINRRGQVQRVTEQHVLSVAERIGFHAVPGLRRRLSEGAPARTFGFLLNRKERYLYTRLASLLSHATTTSPNIQGKAIIWYLEDISAEATAEALLKLGEECDVVAGVCIDHPRVNIAMAQLSEKGIPFWAMLSDVSAPERAGFIGANGRKIGRSAAWFMRRLLPNGGKVALLLGSSQYICQQEYESGFRIYLRENAPTIAILPTRETLENDATAFEFTKKLLSEHADLAGLYMAGGGIDGITAAFDREQKGQIAVISTEISDRTRLQLLDGLIDVALSHPAELIASQTIRAMEAEYRQGTSPTVHTVLQEIAISESI